MSDLQQTAMTSVQLTCLTDLNRFLSTLLSLPSCDRRIKKGPERGEKEALEKLFCSMIPFEKGPEVPTLIKA